MTEIDGYNVMQLKTTAEAAHPHTIFAKEHWIRIEDDEKPKGRTLFLLNVPPYVTEDSLRVFFSKSGKVESVLFAEKPGRDESTKWAKKTLFSAPTEHFRFKVAYVVFKSESSLKKALAVSSIDLFNEEGRSVLGFGPKKWQKEYEEKFIEEDVLQERIDEYMAEYDRKEKAEYEASKTTEADNGGWVTVGKQGRNAGFEQKESVIGKIEDKMAKSKKTKELKNFYTFQIRQTKMQHIVDLRKKFEDDKKKIEVLKQGRRFKPF